MGFRNGDLIAEKYRITRKLGEGHFGKVYEAIDRHDKKYAVKVEKEADGELEREKIAYEALAVDRDGDRAIGIPRMYYYGQKSGHDVLVLEYLGSSLYDKAKENGGTFSLKTCLMLAVQLITRLEHIHGCGFLHRDIKPDNILTGGDDHRPWRIYIADYGLAESFRDTRGRHVEYERFDGFSGTTRYSSVNVMRGVRAARRDDLESLAYSLIELRKGRLPWKRDREARRPDDDSRHQRRVLRMKMEMPVREIADGFPGMHKFLKYVRRLGFSDRPMYSYLKDCFIKAMDDYRIRDDGKFDWVQ